MIKNCLTISIVFRLKHKHSKMKMKLPELFNIAWYDIKATKKYLRYLYTNESLSMIFIPHFYIVYRKIKISFDKDKIRRYNL